MAAFFFTTLTLAILLCGVEGCCFRAQPRPSEPEWQSSSFHPPPPQPLIEELEESEESEDEEEPYPPIEELEQLESEEDEDEDEVENPLIDEKSPTFRAFHAGSCFETLGDEYIPDCDGHCTSKGYVMGYCNFSDDFICVISL